MEALICATVLAVWGLGALVVCLAWLATADARVTSEIALGTALVADRKAALLPTSAPVVLARTPVEFAAWRARRDALLATAPTQALAGRDRVTPPQDVLAAWAQQSMGLRLASDMAVTKVDQAAPVSAALESDDMAEWIELPAFAASSEGSTHGVCDAMATHFASACAETAPWLLAPTHPEQASAETSCEPCRVPLRCWAPDAASLAPSLRGYLREAMSTEQHARSGMSARLRGPQDWQGSASNLANMLQTVQAYTGHTVGEA